MDWRRRLFPQKQEGSSLYTDALECLLRGDTDGAFVRLRKLVETDTSHIRAYVKMGDILRQSGKAEQAVKIHQSLKFRRSLSTAQKVEIHSSLARDYYDQGRLSRAEENANEVLKTDRKNRWAAEFLVKICEQGNRWSQARQYLGKLEKITGEDLSRRHAYCRMMEGRVRKEQGHYGDARDYFLKATKLDKTFADPYLYLGNLFQRQNDLEKAVENWMIFAELSPGSGKQVFDRLEKALYELGRFGEMEEFYRKLVTRDPSNLEAVAGLVDVLAAKGEIDQAVNLLEKIVEKNEKSIPARLVRLKVLLHKIDQEQLSKEVDEILKLIHTGGDSTVRPA
ncbi:MAG: tetratricopeptide repeat protein [Fidelibacterota bacterium]